MRIYEVLGDKGEKGKEGKREILDYFGKFRLFGVYLYLFESEEI